MTSTTCLALSRPPMANAGGSLDFAKPEIQTNPEKTTQALPAPSMQAVLMAQHAGIAFLLSPGTTFIAPGAAITMSDMLASLRAAGCSPTWFPPGRKLALIKSGAAS